MHIGGDLVMKPRLSYKNGIVEYFDHFNCDEGSILDLRRMVKQLRFCDKKVQFWYKYGNTRKPKVMKLSSDADILGLITDIPKNKELDIYVEHHYDDQWDYEVEIDRELGDDTLMHDEVESEDEFSGSVGGEFVEVEGVDVRDTATSSHGQGLDGLGKQNEDFAELSPSPNTRSIGHHRSRHHRRHHRLRHRPVRTAVQRCHRRRPVPPSPSSSSATSSATPSPASSFAAVDHFSDPPANRSEAIVDAAALPPPKMLSDALPPPALPHSRLPR
nr:uncharacterized protein LOC109193258 [Ipomoea trifida]